ncbi:MAG: hypothetical protein Q7U68_07115 [Candidatus Roizmanbacteria bacterium]|nr:hypothetical protein [Candidatus Roizmanbacteria bacterium]
MVDTPYFDVTKTTNYKENIDDQRVTENVVIAINEWAKTFNRTQSNRSRLYFRSPRNIFEIWDIRIPDPDQNKGSSGGFRLTCFIQLKENVIWLHAIIRRNKIGFKQERPKDKQKFEKSLQELKAELMDQFESY